MQIGQIVGGSPVSAYSTAQVAQIYRSIPESEKARTVILAGNYGEAGALDFYGGEYGLPRIVSNQDDLAFIVGMAIHG